MYNIYYFIIHNSFSLFYNSIIIIFQNLYNSKTIFMLLKQFNYFKNKIGNNLQKKYRFFSKMWKYLLIEDS